MSLTCPGHSFIHLSRLFRFFFRAARHALRISFRVHLIVFSTSQSQASRTKREGNLSIKFIMSDQLYLLKTFNHLIFLLPRLGKDEDKSIFCLNQLISWHGAESRPAAHRESYMAVCFWWFTFSMREGGEGVYMYIVFKEETSCYLFNTDF